CASMSETFAVKNRPLPVGLTGVTVHVNPADPTVPEQVTVAAPPFVDPLVQMSPAAAPALTLNVAVVPVMPLAVSAAVSAIPDCAVTSVMDPAGTVPTPFVNEIVAG